MQTWLVHMRRPRRLWRDLNPAGAIAFQIFFAANALSALLHPFFMAGLGYTVYALPAPWARAVLENAAPIFLISLCSAYGSTVALDIVGLCRRRLLRHAWVLIVTPLHWLLLSLAAWRALFQLIYDPQRWEKTEHGLARNSRLADARGAQLRRRSMPLDGGRHKLRVAPAQMPMTAKIRPAAPIAPLNLMQASPGAIPM